MSPDDLARWQGKVDAHLEALPKQIDTLFKAVDVEEKARQVLDDEISKRLNDCHEKLKKQLDELTIKLSNLTARLAVIAAIGSFVGTVVTSLFVAAIIKIFIK